MTLNYFSNEDLQKSVPEFRNNFSTKVEYNSDEENNTSMKNNCGSEQEDRNVFVTETFFVKYHCERVKLKAIALWTEKTALEWVDVKLTLLKKAGLVPEVDNFEPVESVRFSIHCVEPFVEHRQILLHSPQCCSIKLTTLNCPIIFYQQISLNATQHLKQFKLKKPSNKQDILLQQIRKLIKKQRYQTFILKKQLSHILKNIPNQPIKLPLHFISKQQMSMDQVQTDEFRFFKYFAFYEHYHTSREMLKEEIAHINFDKISGLKNFVDAFEKEELILSALEDHERLFLQKKHKNYIIEDEITTTIDKMLERSSNYQLKIKKDKIKQLQGSISPASYYTQHIFQNDFFPPKVTKKNPHQRNFVKYPLVFRDIYCLQKKVVSSQFITTVHKKQRKKKKYLIFAHGFQGLPIDLAFLIHMVKFSNQKVKTFVLKSYNKNMGENIEAMAWKVAQEIQSIVKKIDLKEIQPQISFIGHSMGPIILRASFKHLQPFKQYFSQFISICAPHLGYIQGTKFLTQAGLSILSKLKPIQSLNQLSNRDSKDLQKTFIYKLSKQGSLAWFKKVVLIASMEDDYVPWHSARIEPIHHKEVKDKIEKEMIQNIFGLGLMENRIEKIQRVEVNFLHEKEKYLFGYNIRSLNSFIGRTSHIKPLNDRGFLQMLTRHILSF